MRDRNTKFQFFDNQEPTKAYILNKHGSKKLYVLFKHRGARLEKSTGVDDTQANRRKLRAWLDRKQRMLDDGSIGLADVFNGIVEKVNTTVGAEPEQNNPSPQDIKIGDYIKHWRQDVMPSFDSEIKRFDYNVILRCWVTPYFAEKTFYDVTRLEIQKFIGIFRLKIGPNKGKTLSRSRASNILTVLRTIFNDAADEYHWDVPDPFRNIKRYMPKKTPQRREIFRIDEWSLLLGHIDPWHRPMVDFMMLTGMIQSEIAGLMRTDIRSDHIMVQHSIVRDVLSDTLKTVYRVRKLPITDRMRNVLNEVLARTDSNFVFAGPNGKPFRREPFLKAVWAKAVAAAGIDYRPPYSIRHSFAAWSLTAGVDPMRLVRLMGHGSKQMVYEVYGHYVDGLETDYWDMVTYFGRDYVEVKRRAALHTPGESCTMLQMPINKAPDVIISSNFGESCGESRGLQSL